MAGSIRAGGLRCLLVLSRHLQPDPDDLDRGHQPGTDTGGRGHIGDAVRAVDGAPDMLGLGHDLVELHLAGQRLRQQGAEVGAHLARGDPRRQLGRAGLQALRRPLGTHRRPRRGHVLMYRRGPERPPGQLDQLSVLGPGAVQLLDVVGLQRADHLHRVAGQPLVQREPGALGLQVVRCRGEVRILSAHPRLERGQRCGDLGEVGAAAHPAGRAGGRPHLVPHLVGAGTQLRLQAGQVRIGRGDRRRQRRRRPGPLQRLPHGGRVRPHAIQVRQPPVRLAQGRVVGLEDFQRALHAGQVQGDPG